MAVNERLLLGDNNMADTKENILMAALHLFARDGYEAVSVSTIAGELGITKGALYKHYKNKRDISDSIVALSFFSDRVEEIIRATKRNILLANDNMPW